MKGNTKLIGCSYEALRLTKGKPLDPLNVAGTSMAPNSVKAKRIGSSEVWAAWSRDSNVTRAVLNVMVI